MIGFQYDKDNLDIVDDFGERQAEEYVIWRTFTLTCKSRKVWRATTVVVEMYSLMGMVAGATANFGPFCTRLFFRC